ncbi:MAG: glycosyltransferase [Anaerolineae bacterium]|nr:glycosyltransferase [Anaerolineae bacterium]
MHSLQITPYYVPAYAFGGVVRVVEGLSQALVARGHDVTVLTTDAFTREEPLHHSAEEMLDGVHVLRCRNRVYPLRRVNLSTPFGMRSVLRHILPTVDVVHLHEFRTVESLLATQAAAQSGVPVVLSPHGTLTRTTGRSTMKSLWDRLLSPGVAQKIEHVIALTEAEAGDVRSLWRELLGSEPDISIIPNGIHAAEFASLPDAADFRQRYGLGSDRVVLFLGRLHPRKGVDMLVRAFLQANLPHTRLLLAGADEGALQAIRPLLDDRIIHVGFLDATSRLEALAAADLFALPAKGEGLSLASLEALAAGVPVLLSPECYLPEVESAGAGRVVAPEVAPLAKALRDLFAEPATLAAMREPARQLIAAGYTWERVAAQVEAVYNLY